MYWFVIYICTDGISLTKLQINWSCFPFHFSLTHGYVLACLSWCETADLSWLYLFAVLPWDWGHTFVDWPTIFWLLWKWLVLILLVVGLLLGGFEWENLIFFICLLCGPFLAAIRVFLWDIEERVPIEKGFETLIDFALAKFSLLYWIFTCVPQVLCWSWSVKPALAGKIYT